MKAMNAVSQDADSRTERYTVLKVWPHDTEAYTEGLVYVDCALYESAGGSKNSPGIGPSTIRRTDLNSRYPLKRFIDDDYFAEGITIFGDKVYQLTDTEVGFIYDVDLLKPLASFKSQGSGWGLTRDSSHLIKSDGSPTLLFIDPVRFTVDSTLPVTEGGHSLALLNEL